MKAFITGATGFVGQALCNRLLNDGHLVVAMGRNNGAMFQHKNLAWVKADFENAPAILEGMKGCTHVFHCGALARVWDADPNAFFRTNVTGTENVLNAARKNGIEKLVFTSTAGVIGRSLSTPMTETDPRLEPFDNDYDLTKHLAEQKVLDYADEGHWAAIVRPSRIYGSTNGSPSNPVTATFRRYLKNEYYFIPGNGNYKSNYVYIDDVIDGHIKSINHGTSGEVYILGGENISYNELFQHFENLSGLHRKRIQVSAGMISFISHLMLGWAKLLGSDPFITPSYAKKLFCNRLLSTKKAEEKLGYIITPITEGLAKTMEDIGFSPAARPRGDLPDGTLPALFS